MPQFQASSAGRREKKFDDSCVKRHSLSFVLESSNRTVAGFVLSSIFAILFSYNSVLSKKPGTFTEIGKFIAV